MGKQTAPGISSSAPKTSVVQDFADRQLQPAAPPIIPARFFVELRHVARNCDAAASLQTLERRFTNRKKKVRATWKQFQGELAAISQNSPVIVDPKGCLPKLGQKLGQWRARTIERLKTIVAELPIEDDPLRCAISLFGTIDPGRVERSHTKLLAWLCHPKKEHGFETALLKTLFQRLEIDATQLDQQDVTSEAEYPIEGRQRIDVFLEGKCDGNICWSLIIEAKIDAREGEKQLANYDRWIEKKRDQEIVTRVFLSPDGRAADTSSTGKWKSITFLNLISSFRNALPSLKGKPGYQYLVYYMTGILKDVYRWKLPIPIDNFDDCVDPYGVLRYLKDVKES